MSQVTDRTVGANPTGFDMRTELNNIIGALESDNSGSSEPLNTVAYMKWIDTSNATYYYVKERNHDNTAWVTLFRYTVATKIMEAVSNGVVLQDTAIQIHASTSKTTLADADEIGLLDSASSFSFKKLTWANLKTSLVTYLSTTTGFAISLSGNNGYIKFPSWLGGFIIQWGVNIITSGSATITLPLTFPTSNKGVYATISNTAGTSGVINIPLYAVSSFSAETRNLSGTLTQLTINWLSIGY